MMKKIMIFINYCSADQSIVDKLKERFRELINEYRENNVDIALVSMDDYCHGRWDEWMVKIAHECDIMIPVLTENSMYPEDGVTKYINDELRIGRKHGKNMVPFVLCDEIPGVIDAHIGGMSQVWYAYGASRDPYGEVVSKVKLLVDAAVSGNKIKQAESTELIGIAAPLKNKYFVGRENELEQIHEALVSSNIVILKGEGGIGKTSLAEAYFASHPELYGKGYIINASDGIIKCIADMPFLGNEHIKDEEDKYRASIRKLSSYNEKTVIIFDNCDTEIEEKELSDLKNTRCRYIITSRVGQSELSDISTVSIGKMSDGQLLKMFYARYPDIAEDNGKSTAEMDKWLLDFFEFVGGHTLAVEMASVIMRDADEPIETVKTALFECKDRIFTANKERMSAFHYLSVLYDFAKLTATELEIIRAVCLIAPSVGIERRTLKKLLALDTNEQMRDLVRNTYLRESAKKLSMHPLFSDVFYRKDTTFNSPIALIITVKHVMSQKLSRDSMGVNRDICAQMEFIVEKRSEVFEVEEAKSLLPEFLYRLSELLCEISEYERSLKYYTRALSLAESGGNSELSAFCRLGIGRAKRALGLYNDAISNLEAASAYHSPCREFDFECAVELGASYMSLGDYANSRALLEKAIASPDRECYPYLLARAYDALGGLHSRLADYGEASLKYGKALALYEALPDAPKKAVADCYTNIGVTSEKLGKYSQAIDYHNSAIEILTSLYGELPSMALADSYSHRSNAYRKMSDTDMACDGFERALSMYRAVIPDGKAHPRIADCLNSLGAVELARGNCEKALEHLNLALDACRSIYSGKPHPKYANAYNNVGSVYYELGDFGKAIEYYKKAYEIRLSAYGTDADHPAIATSLMNVGRALFKQDSTSKDAVICLKNAVDMFERVYAENPSHKELNAAKDALAAALAAND